VPSQSQIGAAGTELPADAVASFIYRRWPVLLAAAVVGATIGLILSFVLPKTYRAEVLLAPVVSDSGSPMRSVMARYGALAGLAGLDLGEEQTATEAAIATLSSRSFIEDFIAERKLLPVLFADQWDAQRSEWKSRDEDDQPALQDGYLEFRDHILSVLEDDESGLVRVRVEWRDPVQAAEWANALVSRMNEAARQRAIRLANRSVEFLQRELQHTQTVEIRQSIYTLLQTQINNRMVANTRPDYAFNVIDPAKPSRPNKYVRPVRLLLVIIGFFSGVLLATAALLSWPYLRAARVRSAGTFEPHRDRKLILSNGDAPTVSDNSAS